MGLLDIYGGNPHERRIKATGAMMGDSGFAKPALAYVMGREMAGAEEWDKERGEAASRAAKDAADSDWAQKILGQVVDLSKKDAVAATQVLRAESARNPYLAPFSGIQFNAETTAEGWATYTDGTGQGWQTFLPALNKKNEDGTPLSDEQLEQQGFRRKIGAPKPAESPKLETNTFELGPKGERTLGATHRWRLDPSTGKPAEYLGPADTDTSRGGGGGGEAKVGQLNLVRKTLAMEFATKLTGDPKEALDIVTSISDPVTGQVNLEKLNFSLGPEQRTHLKGALLKAEKYASTMTPAEAAYKAIDETIPQARAPLAGDASRHMPLDKGPSAGSVASPTGAKLLSGKTIKGKQAYQLPNGSIWTE